MRREMNIHLHYLPGTCKYEYLEDSGDEYSFLDQSAKNTKMKETLAYFFRRIIIFANLSFLSNHYCLVCGQYGDRTHLVLQQGISQMQLVVKA